MQARQGDIFFESKTPPQNPHNHPLDTPTLAYGEVTGHSHTIMSPRLSDPGMKTEVDAQTGDIYVMSDNEDVLISHDEHEIITLPKGEWFCITRQREYDPIAAERERIVKD